jgi:hypothetical protein
MRQALPPKRLVAQAGCSKARHGVTRSRREDPADFLVAPGEIKVVRL